VIIIDTGPLVAAAINDDDDHERCNEMFLLLRATGKKLVIPETVVAEVGYMLATRGTAEKEAEFLDSIADGTFSLASPDQNHIRREALRRG